MQILSIGNSFSQDAQRYLHRIAAADGYDLTTFNLYIGGCPLSRHHRNMLSGERAYTLEMNGVSTDFPMSLEEALLNRSWDVVTVQQASHESTDYENYQPYLDKLAAYVRTCVPKAKLAVHETWAYEQGSDRLEILMGYRDHKDMFRDIEKAYKQVAEDIKAEIFLPSGELLQELITAGFEKVHRDTFHASFGAGRYAIALLWYAILTGRDIEAIPMIDTDEPITAEEFAVIKAAVSKLAAAYKVQ